MNAQVIAFFNNKGGVGKTSLVYHLAWMYSEAGVRVVAADFDPQANLSAAFLDEDELEQVWSDDSRSRTVFGSVQPIVKGTGDTIVVVTCLVCTRNWPRIVECVSFGSPRPSAPVETSVT